MRAARGRDADAERHRLPLTFSAVAASTGYREVPDEGDRGDG
jgi:hypothetical protein